MHDWRREDLEDCVPPPEVLRIMTVHFDAQYRSELAEWEEHLLTPLNVRELLVVHAEGRIWDPGEIADDDFPSYAVWLERKYPAGDAPQYRKAYCIYCEEEHDWSQSDAVTKFAFCKVPSSIRQIGELWIDRSYRWHAVALGTREEEQSFTTRQLVHKFLHLRGDAGDAYKVGYCQTCETSHDWAAAWYDIPDDAMLLSTLENFHPDDAPHFEQCQRVTASIKRSYYKYLPCVPPPHILQVGNVWIDPDWREACRRFKPPPECADAAVSPDFYDVQPSEWWVEVIVNCYAGGGLGEHGWRLNFFSQELEYPLQRGGTGFFAFRHWQDLMDNPDDAFIYDCCSGIEVWP